MVHRTVFFQGTFFAVCWFAFLASPAFATTRTVCASGCDTTTISAALSLSSFGDYVEVQASSTGVGESLPLTVPAGVQLYCPDTNTVIDFDGKSDTQATIIMNSTSTVMGCSFGHVILKLGWVDAENHSDQTINGNVFSRTATSSIMTSFNVTSSNVTISANTDIQELRLSSLIESIQVTGNTFYYNPSSIQSGILAIGSYNALPSSATFSGNTIEIHPTTSTSGGSVINFSASSLEVTSNTFQHIRQWNSTTGMTDVSVFVTPVATISSNTFITPSSTEQAVLTALYISAGDIATTITNNTFFLTGSVPASSNVTGLKFVDTGSAGNYTLNATTSYNLFYFGGTPDDNVIGMQFQMNNGTYTLNLEDSYEGFYGFNSNKRLVTNVLGSLGTPLYTSNPYMQTLDADPTNDHILAMFSPWRGVGPSGESIGAEGSPRAGLVNIDDDGVISYGIVDATSTSVIGDVARSYDTFYLADGTYAPITLTSSTGRTSNITIDGTGSGAIINVSATSSDAGIALYNMSNMTISDLTIQNASSARLSSSYYSTRMNYAFGGNDYNEGDGELIPPNNTIVAGSVDSCDGFEFVSADATAVVAFNGASNIHLALGLAAGFRVTLLVPNSIATDQVSLEANACLVELGWTTTIFIANAFSASGGVYTYDSATVTTAGATLLGGLSTPAIARTSSPQIGILVSGGQSNSTNNVTSTSNYYGAYASSTETWTILDSTFSSNTYDFRKTSGDFATAATLSNSTFDTSKAVIDDGEVGVWMRARIRTVNGSGDPIAGVSVSSTSSYILWYGIGPFETDENGYTAYSSPQPAGYMLPGDTDFTAGGDNQYASPYYATTTATSTYSATSTLYNLTSVNQTVTLVMEDNASAPTAPTGLTVSNTSTTRATITWTDASSNETGFVIEYSTGTSPVTWNSIQVNTPGLSTYTFTTLIPNTLYSFRVAATGTYGISSYTSEVTTTTHTLIPASVVTTAMSQTSMTLDVQRDSGGLNPTSTTYAVYIALSSNFGGGHYVDASGANNGATQVWQTTSSWYGVNISGLTCGTSYDLATISKNSAGVHNEGLGEYSRVTTSTSACSVVTNQPSNGGGTGGGGGGSAPLLPAPPVASTTSTTSTAPSTSPTSTTQTSFWTPPAQEQPSTTPPKTKQETAPTPAPLTPPAPLTKAEKKAVDTRILKQLRRDFRTYGVKAKKADEDRLVLFVLRGTTEESIKIGERERFAVVRDALDLLKTATFPISDLERMIDGLPMKSRNLKREKQLMPDVARVFRAITKRTLNLKKEADLPIYNAIMYRVRIPRDLEQERVTIKTFTKLFRHRPSTPFDWAVVRAMQLATKK